MKATCSRCGKLLPHNACTIADRINHAMRSLPMSNLPDQAYLMTERAQELRDLVRDLSNLHQWAVREAAAEIDRKGDAIDGLLGLLQLIAHRTDCPDSIRVVMNTSHRVTEARAAQDPT